MTTVKNRAARAAETREEKRTRLADPALDAYTQDQQEFQANNQTLQANMSAARKTEFTNRKAEFDGDIRNLQRMKDRAARGYVEAAKAGYDRTYVRVERLAQVLADEFGYVSIIPAYDPPVNGLPDKTRTVTPRSAQERAQDGAYRETRGLGPSGKGGPPPGFPGTDADAAWLNVQGAKK